MPTESFAVITGASSGFGADFARDLARRGYDLVLVARRADKLADVANAVREATGRRVEIVVADLAVDAERERLAAHVATLGAPIEVLVNNAGLGLYGRFTAIPWAAQKQMLDVDIDAVVHLCALLVPSMIARGNGYVLNIASTGAYQPTPLYAAYSAAKAFVLSFSHALRAELRGTGVSVTCVSPGVAATEFLAVSKQEATPYQKLTRMTSAEVVDRALRALFARRAEIVPGPVNAFVAFTTRLTPRPLLASLAYRLMKSNEPAH